MCMRTWLLTRHGGCCFLLAAKNLDHRAVDMHTGQKPHPATPVSACMPGSCWWHGIAMHSKAGPDLERWQREVQASRRLVRRGHQAAQQPVQLRLRRAACLKVAGLGCHQSLLVLGTALRPE